MCPARGSRRARALRCYPRPGRACTVGSFRLGLFTLGLVEQLGDTLGFLELLGDVRHERRGRAGLAGPGQDLDHLPALRRAVRAALLNAHEVALAHLARLVVGVEALSPADDLLIERVLAHAADGDDHGLRLLRRDDHSDLRLAAEAAPPGGLLADRRGRVRDGPGGALWHGPRPFAEP